MNCEQVRMAAMALADGETPPLSRAVIEAHVAECAECRQEIAKMEKFEQMWKAQSRGDHLVEMWPRVSDRLQSRVVKREKRHWLAALAVLLVVFKLIEFIPDRSLGMWVQLVPLLLAAAVFAVARQNPFQVKTELIQDRA